LSGGEESFCVSIAVAVVDVILSISLSDFWDLRMEEKWGGQI
jgi:hypothetical protein